ncbi:3-hydroxybutyryl-CoA dehydrogenase [Melghirimyces profundicolus]|uniref:3-hydroxybutyryl-CoA dehydrogenase n=1 Tax=Melghirimyces profundicolus TaxID=1242148 RepID=A0A2T6C2C9_9BACL|nr:3-hydroxybutyryl-CoA dehydrogenase [Melghirimyces profundicolus]PTX62476.1 3-hydroxybutyryl-CoA dehydrogenase [Melghirimyces profundicolus]
MSIRNFTVVGAGQMGSGIAQVAAQSGFTVRLLDLEEAFVRKGMRGIDKYLFRQVEKGRLTETEKGEVLSRIRPTTDLAEAVRETDIVVEAVVENMEVKTDLFKKLDEKAPGHAILATNTSSLPITGIAAATQRPDHVIGMHFMNPVPVMKLVEVIRGLATSDNVFEAVEKLARDMGKHPVEVNDSPGFVSNRVLMPMINEAVYTVYEGVAEPEAVDEVMKLGMNHPMGPLTLADFIGLDTCLYIMETLYEGFGDPKYRPCPLLRKYVKAGWLGRKTGRGFYTYE